MQNYLPGMKLIGLAAFWAATTAWADPYCVVTGGTSKRMPYFSKQVVKYECSDEVIVDGVPYQIPWVGLVRWECFAQTVSDMEDDTLLDLEGVDDLWYKELPPMQGYKQVTLPLENSRLKITENYQGGRMLCRYTLLGTPTPPEWMAINIDKLVKN